MAKGKLKLTASEREHIKKGMSKRMVDVHGNPMSTKRKLGALYNEIREARSRGWTKREAVGPSKDVRKRPVRKRG